MPGVLKGTLATVSREGALRDLGDQTFISLIDEGTRFTTDQAITYALNLDPRPG